MSSNSIKSIISDFYSKNKKSKFSKNKQKLELAENIINTISITDYIEKCIYIKDFHIFASYPDIKHIIHPNTYNIIMERLNSLIVSLNQSCCFHVDIFSLSISAIHRIQDLIKLLLANLKEDNKLDLIEHIYIHNPPNSIKTINKIISPIFSGTGFLNKVTFIN